jgi:uncharacterized protein (DUF433 family)
MAAHRDRITIDPAVCNGKPTVRGKRIAVQTVLEHLSAGDTLEQLLDQFPSLEPDDINACLEFAADLMDRNYVIKLVA